MLQIICKASPAEFPDEVQYLVLYTYGLLKSVIMSPNLKAPLSSSYLDFVALKKFLLMTYGPDECLSMFHPQIYRVSDP